MKVAFWSGAPRIGGVTGNLAAISTVCALCHGTQIVIASNHFSGNMVRDCFDGRAAYRTKREENYRFCYGEPEYFRMLWEEEGDASFRNVQGLSWADIRVLAERIVFLQPPDLSENGIFTAEVPKNSLYMIDVAGGNGMAASQALEEADVVAVFLPQEKEGIAYFFEYYSSLIPKSLFFINNYRRSRSGIREFMGKNYGIEKQKIEVIPYNAAYARAYAEGNIASFIKANLDCTPKSSNYNLIRHLREAAKMLLREKAFW